LIGTISAFEPMSSAGYLSGKSLQWAAMALEHGVLLRPLGDTVYLLPPYSSSEEDIAMAYEVIDGLM
jgi:adenosylmethionine-8-amino-7-oxononanoate aminotransferase